MLKPQGALSGVWVRGREAEALAEQIRSDLPRLKVYLTRDAALATGIASAEQLATAKAGGAAALSGPYLAHPPVIPGNKQDTGRVVLLRLLTLITQDGDLSEIEQLFRREPGLSFHLLRLVNSSGMGLAKKISSLNQAILLLGMRQLQRWVQLLLYANKSDSADNPLLFLAALRGNLLEHLAVAQGCDAATREQAFMTGIFSLLDSLLGMEMQEITTTIQLPDAVQAALLQRQGMLGELLAWVEDVHAGAEPRPLALDTEQCASLQLEALRWAMDVGAGMA